MAMDNAWSCGGRIVNGHGACVGIPPPIPPCLEKKSIPPCLPRPPSTSISGLILCRLIYPSLAHMIYPARFLFAPSRPFSPTPQSTNSFIHYVSFPFYERMNGCQLVHIRTYCRLLIRVNIFQMIGILDMDFT